MWGFLRPKSLLVETPEGDSELGVSRGPQAFVRFSGNREQVATGPGLEWEPEELDLCSDGGGSRGRFGTENKVT